MPDNLKDSNSRNKSTPNEGLSIEISTFPNKFSSTATRLTLNREKIVKFLSKRGIRPEKDGKLFAPATFNGSRSDENFIAASGICLDFDHGTPTIDQLLELFPVTFAAYYSTFSHCWKNKQRKVDGATIPEDRTYTPENPCFRVVIPLSRPVNSDEHVLLVLGIKSIIPAELLECLDTSCFEKARSHYLPSCPPEHECHAFSGYQDGVSLDVDHFISLGNAAVKAEIKSSAQEDVQRVLAPTRYEFTDPNTDEIYDLTSWAAKNPAFEIITAVAPQYHRGKMRDGKQHLICPFEDQHTDQSSDLATFVANASSEYPSFTIHCMHSHCVDRDRLEFLMAMLEKGWLVGPFQAAVAKEIEKKRPPKVYFPVNEFLADPAWVTLKADERRVALDLWVKSVSENGTIADDDWMIARYLGLHENEWLVFRKTLCRTGCLIKSGDRLSIRIAKEQFESAQAAYMAVIVKAGNGGRKAQITLADKRLLQASASSTCFKHLDE